MTYKVFQLAGKVRDQLNSGDGLKLEVDGEEIEFGSPEYVAIQNREVEEHEVYDDLLSYGKIIRLKLV